MKTFPMFFQMAGRQVVIVGGGEQAAQKTRLLLKSEAELIVLADSLDDELSALVGAGRMTSKPFRATVADFEGAALVFVATGCPGADASWHGLAKAAGAVVNVVDQPGLCDVITPSIVDRDPVVVAIGTEGTAPVLARQIKTQVEQLLEPDLGALAALAGRLRDSASARLSPRLRRDLWRWVFAGAPRALHAGGAHREAARLIKQAIATGDFAQDTGGSIAFVGAGPGDKDLITLRGVQRLQEADVIYYDPATNPEILELARRDAERVLITAAPAAHGGPGADTLDVLGAAAQDGQRVVCLTRADPATFLAECDGIAALRATGLRVESVAGIRDPA